MSDTMTHPAPVTRKSRRGSRVTPMAHHHSAPVSVPDDISGLDRDQSRIDHHSIDNRVVEDLSKYMGNSLLDQIKSQQVPEDKIKTGPYQDHSYLPKTIERCYASAMLDHGTWDLEPDKLSIDWLHDPKPFQWLYNHWKLTGKMPRREVAEYNWPGYFVRGINFQWAKHQMHIQMQRTQVQRVLSESVTFFENEEYDKMWNYLHQVSPLGDPVDDAPVGTTVSAALAENPDQHGMAVPWPTLERLTKGPKPGELWYVAGRLGFGKSYTLTEMAYTLAASGKQVAYLSLEMPAAVVARRMSVIHQSKGYKADEVPVPEVRLIDPSHASMTPATVTALAATHDVVIIDYVGLMRSAKNKRAVEDWRIIAEISNELKQIALSTSTAIIAAAQVNRDGARVNSMPDPSNLASSDALGQDADVIVMLKRRTLTSKVMQMKVSKNRSGQCGSWYTMFDSANGNFAEIDDRKALGILTREDEQT